MDFAQLSNVFYFNVSVLSSSLSVYVTLSLTLSLSSTSPFCPSVHLGALQIEMSEESDQGKYECVATNSDGTRYSTPANLYVRGKWTIKADCPVSTRVQLVCLDLMITLLMYELSGNQKLFTQTSYARNVYLSN